MHVFLFDLITDQEFRLLLVGRGHSCTFPSYSKRSICPHVSAVLVFFHSDSFLMPEDFTVNFPNFPYASSLRDHANEEVSAPIINLLKAS